MWYEYRQTNSGGSFDFTTDLGQYVWVEARNASEADGYAQYIGIYFDKDYNIDCDCCGTRWSPADSHWTHSGKETLAESLAWLDDYKPYWPKWDENNRAGVAHHKNGTVEQIYFRNAVDEL